MSKSVNDIAMFTLLYFYCIALLLRACRGLSTVDVAFPPIGVPPTKILFDFRIAPNLNDWHEISDTVRTVGKSKATLVLQTTQIFQHAILFTLLNPQPNGAGFAGVRMQTNLNLSNYGSILIACRGQGKNSHYKVVLRHRGLDSNEDVSYEQLFTAPMSETEFSTVALPLTEFKAYYRGRRVPNAPPLDKSSVTMIGLQIYGGVYSAVKQKGLSALEIESISVA